MSSRPAPTLRQQRILAATRLAGAVIAMLVLGVASVRQLLGGAPLQGSVLFLCLMTLVSIAYGWWCATRLDKAAKAEKAAAQEQEGA